MGLTFNLGRVSPSVFTDSSLNVGIGAAPSGTYKLEVTGTGRFTTARTNGTNVNILTLSDTTTGVQTVGFGTRIQYLSNGTSVEAAIGLEQGGTGTNNESQISFYTQNTASALSKQLTIGSTGAATFSSTITTAGNITLSGDGGAGGMRLILNNTGTSEVQYILLSGGSAGTGIFGIRNGASGSNLLLINATGAATFTQKISVKGGSASGGYYMDYQTDASSRSFRISSEHLVYGDFVIQKSTTRTGTTYEDLLYFNASRAATFSSSIAATTGTLSTTFNGGGIGMLHITSNGTEGGTITFEKTSGTAQKFKFGLGVTSLFIYNETAGNQPFTLTSGGQFVMGRTTPSGSGRLTVDGDLYLHNISAGAGNSTLKYNYTSTGLVTYDTSSRLLKKDIENLGYGLDDVLKMSAKKYKWKRDDSIDLGFIADEMVKIIPEIVFFSTEMTNETTGVPIGQPLSINYDRLIPVLVKAIQELSAQNQDLKSRLDKAGL